MPNWTWYECEKVDPKLVVDEAIRSMVQDLKPGVDIDAEIDRVREEIMNSEVYKNELYTVYKRVTPDGASVHLSIKRNDRQPIHDWRDLQRIKNELVGPECEGVELYPAERRKVDTANQFHLWVLTDPTVELPFGFQDGRLVSDKSGGGAIQRPGAL